MCTIQITVCRRIQIVETDGLATRFPCTTYLTKINIIIHLDAHNIIENTSIDRSLLKGQRNQKRFTYMYIVKRICKKSRKCNTKILESYGATLTRIHSRKTEVFCRLNPHLWIYFHRSTFRRRLRFSEIDRRTVRLSKEQGEIGKQGKEDAHFNPKNDYNFKWRTILIRSKNSASARNTTKQQQKLGIGDDDNDARTLKRWLRLSRKWREDKKEWIRFAPQEVWLIIMEVNFELYSILLGQGFLPKYFAAETFLQLCAYVLYARVLC